MKENVKSVYILEMSNDTVKIGVSKNVNARIKAITNGSGLSVLNFYTSPVFAKEIALEIEKACHAKFAAQRIKGEFFNIAFADACDELKSISLDWELKLNGVKTIWNEDFGEIRIVIVDTEIWFVGKDIAQALGYSNSRKALGDHVDEEDKKDGVTIRDSIGREQTPVMINESGLYSLILSSKLPSAKKFKRWVTSEVLPQIRKTGAYISPKPEPEPEPPAPKRVVEMELTDYLKMLLEKYPDAEMVPTGLTQEYDEDGNLCTVFKVGFDLEGSDEDDEY